MFDIGFQEILMVSVLALLVMGPERLPEAIRTGSLWLAKIRRSFSQMKEEIENEVGINADDIRRQLHNEGVLKSLEESKQQLQQGIDSIKPEFENDINEIVESVDLASDATPPAFSRAAKQAKLAREDAEASAEQAAPHSAADIDAQQIGRAHV